MKNLKKLFVVLPLVLVMLLSVVPVMAAEDFKVKDSYVDNAAFKITVDKTAFTKGDYAEWLKVDKKLMPVWVGQNVPFAESNVPDSINDEHMNVVLMNDGAVHGWVTANEDAVSILGIAQTYVAEKLPGYILPSIQLQHVARITKTVLVPQDKVENPPQKTISVEKSRTWVADPAKTVFGADVVLVAANTPMSKEDWLAKFPAATVAEQTMTIPFGSENYTATTVGAGEVADDSVFVLENKDIVEFAKGTQVPAELFANVQNWIINDENGENGKASGTLDLTGKATKSVQVIANGLTAEIEYEDKDVDDVDPTKLVEVKVPGMLIVVEKADIDVAVTHHFVFEDGTEIIQTADQKWSKANGALTIAKVDPTWYMTVPGFTIDTTKTNVEEVRDDENYFIISEKLLKSYKVDLYYTAGEGVDKGQVDAALAGNAANVANAQQLPATGAADSFALVLSSLALVVVGLFFKK